MSNETETSTQKLVRNSRRKVAIVVASVAVATGSIFAVNAFANSKTYAHLKVYAGEPGALKTPFVHHARWGGHHRGGLSRMSDAEIEKMANRIVKHVSIEIDATPEQEVKITELVTALAKTMKPVRNDMIAAREQVREVLLAETVDRQALERIRGERLAEVDRLSKILTTAIADVAEVLTPKQRRVLEERLQQFRSMRGRWHRG